MILDQYGREIKHSSLVPITTRASGRATYDEYYLTPFSTGFAYISPDNENDWKLQSVDERSLATKKADELINIFVNSSPDLDRALSDTKTFANTSWSLYCEEEIGQRILDNALDQMALLGKDLDSKIDELIASAFLWGAIYTESVFDLSGRDFVDLVVISPSQARYQRRDDEIRGQYWQLGQEEKGRFVALEDPTIMYKAINPLPDKPFGRPMVSSSLFPIIFGLGLLRSLRQVVESQAWPRQLWKIDRQVLHDANVNPNQVSKIIKDTEEKIEQYMNNANFDKAKQPIVGSEVINEMIGGVNRVNLGGVKDILDRLDSWVVRGLKQYPILFGINSNSGLSDNSGIQLEAHQLFIRSLQSSIEDMVTRQFQLVLNAAGYPQLTPVFQLEPINSFVRKTRAESLEKEVVSINQLLADRLITRQEARETLKGFSSSFGDLEPELPVTVDTNEIIQLVTAGMLTKAEGRELIVSQHDEFRGMSPELPEELEAPDEEQEGSEEESQEEE